MSYYGSINDNTFNCIVPGAADEVDEEQHINCQLSLSVLLGWVNFSLYTFFGWLILAVSIFLLEFHPWTLDLCLQLFSGATTRETANSHCTFSQVSLRNSFLYVLPSEYETCLQRIFLDVNHTIQTIRALDQIFEQEYVFYSIARDPGFLFPNETAGYLIQFMTFE
jgi:hypothetical protein